MVDEIAVGLIGSVSGFGIPSCEFVVSLLVGSELLSRVDEWRY